MASFVSNSTEPGKDPALVPADQAQLAGNSQRDDLGTLTSLLVGVTIVVALYVGRDVLVPIALAILLSFALAPVVRLLRRAWLGRIPAVFLAVILSLGMILSLGGVIGIQISQLVSSIPTYANTIDQKLVSVRTTALGHLPGIVGKFSQQLQQMVASPAEPATGADGSRMPVPVEMRQPAPSPIEIAERILVPVVSPLTTMGIVFIMAIFILLEQTDLRDRLIRLSGLQDLHRTTRAMDDAAHRLSRYLLTQLALNSFFGLVIGLGLLMIGLPNPLLWGTLATLFRFVPYIGSIMSGLLPTALAAAVDPGWNMAIETAALFAVTETVMGQFVDPLAYGRSTGLAPVSVVIAAIFWTWMWGPIGLILSTPLTVCLVVLGRHIQRLEFLDVLMGNRPALTPVESFYQRILANDPDGVLEQAESLLKDRSLSTYYDEVAVGGLRLAANDTERGALSDVMLRRVQSATSSLVEELASFDDELPSTAKPLTHLTSGLDTPEVESTANQAGPEKIDPAENTLSALWFSPTPVLCISGSALLDRPVADMLIQLLTKNGLGARHVPFSAVSREAIHSLSISEIAMICVCYLDISFSPSQLRYLVRRLRQAAPGVPILIGLWPEDEAQLSADRIQSVVNADHYAGSLHEAVNTCLVLASGAGAGSPKMVVNATPLFASEAV